MKILVVCLGNICRSPIAEGLLQHLAKEKKLDWIIESAGTESYHIGEPPHRSSQQVCIENGINISTQRAIKFQANAFEKYDKIYAMAEDVLEEIKKISGAKYNASKVDLFLNELYPKENRSVKDPWYGNLDGYYEVFDEIEKCSRVIVERYAK